MSERPGNRNTAGFREIVAIYAIAPVGVLISGQQKRGFYVLRLKQFPEGHLFS